MSETCIIVGAGHAAAQLAPSLRQEGWQGRIIVVGEEPHLPYHRPPLSKDFLGGSKTFADILIRPAAVYEKAEVSFISGTRVQSIDRAGRRVQLGDAQVLAYDRLALTIGSRVRTVSLPGVDLPGVHYLRTVADVERIRTHVGAGTSAVIVGGGYIGLEAAATLRKCGMQVTVVEMLERCMQRVTAPQVSEFYTRVHGEEGVAILCRTGVNAFEGAGRLERVVLSDGRKLDAQLVIIGIGIVPNVELAAECGLKTENGIVVDEHARTGDPDIVAAGDCTWHYNRIYERWLRLESVQNSVDQARCAAQTLCGKLKPYDVLPWFWSDQYDLKLQIAGLSQGYDQVVTRGRLDQGRSFAAFYLKDGRVIAVDAVNKPPEFMMGKKLITERTPVDLARLADESVPMRELVK